MNYRQTLDYLFTQLPMYQRIGKAAYKADLSTTRAFDALCNHPHQSFKSIHLAGTNGKGSSSHLLASTLQEAGYKVGLYTSPHLTDFRERIRVNGKMIDQSYIVNFVERYKELSERLAPSFFEWTVALAFEYFKEHKVDYAVIETGMGGRLDSTNIIKPVLSIITNIGMDHQQFLGNSIPLIAKEKAGIIKKDTPVIIGRRQKETDEVFVETAKALNAPLHYAQPEIHYKSALKGPYQKENETTAANAIQYLAASEITVSKEQIIAGFRNVIQNTGLKGRWQTIQEEPRVICDIGHNEDGIKSICQELICMPKQSLHMVLGFVNDKELTKLTRLLPREAKFYFCRADIPRSMDENELLRLASLNGLVGESFKTVALAYETAKQKSGTQDVIFVGGSTFVVAEFLTLQEKEH